jgi:Heavy metal binding domain
VGDGGRRRGDNCIVRSRSFHFGIVALAIIGFGNGVRCVDDARQVPPVTAPPTSVRFHHLHFTVGDPAAAMQTYADALGGTRVIVAGFGVGVRVATWYLLFDRDRSGAETPAAAPGAVAIARRAAGIWLAGHGLDVQADDVATSPLATSTSTPALDHIAFAAVDLATALAAIEARGGTPIGRTADAAMFRMPDGTRVEVLQETDAPDAYWCPMHLDVRSARPGTCPLCAMALVPIPPPSLGEYRMDVTPSAGPKGGGLSGLRLAIRHPSSDKPVPGFATVHEKVLHLFVISRDLEYFAHVHPEAAGTSAFTLKHEAPPGEYMVIADFVPQDGTPQMVHRAVVTPGYTGPLFPPAPALKSDLSADPVTGRSRGEKTSDGLRIVLEADDLVAGRRSVLRFRLSDAAGLPVTDLEPFLGAPGHVLVVRSDLEEAIHAHPEERTTGGPVVTVQALLPSAGTYKLWAQFQRHGTVTTVSFVFEVAAP